MFTPLSLKHILRHGLSAFALRAAQILFLCVLCGGVKTAAAACFPLDGGRDAEETSESDNLVNLHWPGQLPEDSLPLPQALLEEGALQIHIVSEKWKPCFSGVRQAAEGGWRLPKGYSVCGSSPAVSARRSLQILLCRWAV